MQPQGVVKELPASKDRRYCTTEAEGTVGISHEATTSEDIKDLACTVVRSRVHELVRAI
jgi:hypothetical protein